MTTKTHGHPRNHSAGRQPDQRQIASASSVRLLRLPEVCRAVGLRPTAIYLLEREGNFPKRVHLTERAVAWSEQEVSSWISQRLLLREIAR